MAQIVISFSHMSYQYFIMIQIILALSNLIFLLFYGKICSEELFMDFFFFKDCKIF